MNGAIHQCFDRQTLLDFQLGKLDFAHLERIAAEIEGCPLCAQQAATLDGVDDSVMSILKKLGQNNVSSTSDQWPTGDDSQDSFPTLPAPPGDSAGTTERVGPRELGEYVLLEQIGQGGFGTVWKARHRRLNRNVAVKLLSSRHLTNPKVVARFDQEMKAIGPLQHENLVFAHDAGKIDGQPFLVMDLLDGCDVADLIKHSGPLSLAEACEVIRQSALGLAHAHTHGSIHRDVKPSNLMVTLAGQVKVLDLGLARLLNPGPDDEAITRQNELFGTAAFMSPEQSLDASSVDARADIYSLGCTLFYLLCGRPPYPDRPAAGIIEKVLVHSSEPTPVLQEIVPWVPRGVSDLAYRMMAKRPADRPASMNEVVEELTPYCQEGRALLVARLAGHQPKAAHTDETTLPANAVLCEQQIAPTTGWFRSGRGIGLATATLTCLLGSLAWIGWWRQVSGPDDGPNGDASETSNESQVVPLHDAALAATAIVSDFNIPQQLKADLGKAAAQPQADTVWTGQSGELMFSLVAEPLPDGQGAARIAAALTSKATVQATSRLLQTKALLEHYESLGLTNVQTLRQAVVRLSSDQRFVGQVQGLNTVAKFNDRYVVALAYAKAQDIQAALDTTATAESLKGAYRDLMHAESRRLMQEQQWENALLLWRHLHQQRLVSADLYLDAAACFHALHRDDDALRLLEEFLKAYATQAPWTAFEKAGALAEKIEGDVAQELGARAYGLAVERFEIRAGATEFNP